MACRKSLAGLRFELDGEDLTGADARLTQARIERELSVGLLSRAAFHGQADITSLLEACQHGLVSCMHQYRALCVFRASDTAARA